MTSNDTVNELQQLAQAERWAELSSRAEEIALFNTRLLFIAALELAARERNEEASAAADNLNAPMASLINALIEGNIDDIMISNDRNSIADAWISLVDPVVSRSSEPAALQFALLAPIVADDNSRRTAATVFYNNNLWQAAAQILGTISANSPVADSDFFKALGISLYRSADYVNAATSLMTAAERGDTSPETMSYLTWLEEKLAIAEETAHE